MSGLSPIGAGDDVAGDVAGAQASAEARYRGLQADTFGAGSAIGDVLDLPPVPNEHSKHQGGDDSGFAA